MKRAYLLPVLVLAMGVILQIAGALAKLEGITQLASPLLYVSLVLFAVGLIWLIVAIARPRSSKQEAS